MNVEHLKLFIRISVTHNISLAGQEFGLSAAVASAHISKLEQHVGVRLIHRTTRKVSLTEEGAAFLPYAEDVIASVEAAKLSIGSGISKPQGVLRVTASASFGRMHLIPGLGDFLAQYPDLKVDLKLSDTIVDLVEGGFDIAVRCSTMADSSFIARKLAPDHRIVCASPAYIEKWGEPKHPRDLKHHQCITLIGLETWSFNTPEGVINIKAKGNFKTDNGEAVRDACEQGMGININSRWNVYEQLKKGTLVQIMTDFPLVNDTAIWAVYPSTRLLAPKVRAFIDYYLAYFGETPYWLE